MFSHLLETFSRATRSDLAPNETNEGMGEVDGQLVEYVEYRVGIVHDFWGSGRLLGIHDIAENMAGFTLLLQKFV